MNGGAAQQSSKTGAAQTGNPEIGESFVDVGLLSGDGAILADEQGFLAQLDLSARHSLAEGARQNPAATSFEVAELANGNIVSLAAARHDVALGWLVPPPACPVGKSSGVIAVCRLSPAGVRGRLKAFGEAFGLSPSVIRTLVALYEHCDVKLAAQHSGVSFNTAREYLTQARAAIWAPNLPRLITWAGVGSLGTDSSGECDHAIGELFSISDRQRLLAGLVADGASRAEAARELGLSEALAKKELAAVFTATGVTNSMGLARLFAELRGLAIATRHARPNDPYAPPASRTLFFSDSEGRKIAVSDYGPTSGKPVLILHNTMNCRGVDRALVNALQGAGYRPISPDRPGYGDTDPAPAQCHGEDYLALCVRDLALVCENMGWETVPVIAHGPVHLVLALQRLRPDLVEKAIIDAPEPDSAFGKKAQGMIPSLKRQFAKRPWAVASLVKILSTLASHERLSTFMRDWTSASPADHAAMSDPALLMDFYRKLLPFRQGRIDGFVREQVMQATIGRPPVQHGLPHLTLLMGATDFMYNADENMEYWRMVLPDANIVIIPDAGRFISYSHPQRLVAELRKGQFSEGTMG